MSNKVSKWIAFTVGMAWMATVILTEWPLWACIVGGFAVSVLITMLPTTD